MSTSNFHDQDDTAAADDERLLTALSTELRTDARPPLGLEARLYAGVLRHRRERRAHGGLRVVAAALAFSTAAFQSDVAGAVAGMVVAIAYAMLVVPLPRRRSLGR